MLFLALLFFVLLIVAVAIGAMKAGPPWLPSLVEAILFAILGWVVFRGYIH